MENIPINEVVSFLCKVSSCTEYVYEAVDDIAHDRNISEAHARICIEYGGWQNVPNVPLKYTTPDDWAYFARREYPESDAIPKKYLKEVRSILLKKYPDYVKQNPEFFESEEEKKAKETQEIKEHIQQLENKLKALNKD